MLPLPSASTGVEVLGSDSGMLEAMEKSDAKRSIGEYVINGVVMRVVVTRCEWAD